MESNLRTLSSFVIQTRPFYTKSSTGFQQFSIDKKCSADKFSNGFDYSLIEFINLQICQFSKNFFYHFILRNVLVIIPSSMRIIKYERYNAKILTGSLCWSASLALLDHCPIIYTSKHNRHAQDRGASNFTPNDV